MYGWTIWTLRKCFDKKWNMDLARALCAVLNKYWKQHSNKQQLYGHLLPISETIILKSKRHDRHSWENKDKQISDILPQTPSHGHTSVGWSAKIYGHLMTYWELLKNKCLSEEILKEIKRNPCCRHALMMNMLWFTKTHCKGQDFAQSQFLSEENRIWIYSFPLPILLA